jgi:hypothetical protein
MAFQIPILPGVKGKSTAINMKPNPKLNKMTSTTTGKVQAPSIAPEMTLDGKKGGRQKKTKNNKLILPDVYLAPTFRSGPSEPSDSSSSDSFQKAINRSIFYDDSRNAPVKFDYHIDPTVMTQQLEQPQDTDAVFISKFICNMARYSRVPLSPDSTANGYVERQLFLIYSQMSRDVVKTIRSKTVDDWTYVNFHNAIFSVAQALEMFYALDSIQSYSGSDVDRDKNVQNIEMQKLLETNPELLYLKDDLRRTLKGVWFPPMFAELIRWTYQLYKTADLDQATNYRIFPSSAFVRVSASTDIANTIVAEIEAILVNLTNRKFVTIWSILSQVFPEGEIVGLPLSCSTAVYDARHLELLANQPVLFTAGDGTQQVVPDHSNPAQGESFVYGMNSNPDDGDGLPFVLQTMYRTSSDPIIDFLQTFRYEGTQTASYRTNKFALEEGGIFKPRNFEREHVMNESPDVHILQQDEQTFSAVVRRSYIPPGFQPVYFDILTAPLINLRDFMSKMFGV